MTNQRLHQVPVFGDNINPFLDILKKANELKWCVTPYCTTCGCLDFRNEIRALAHTKDNLLVGSLARIDVGELYHYPNWADAIRITLGEIQEASEMDQILNAWLPQLHNNINLADLVLFYFVRRGAIFAPMDIDTLCKWKDSCISLAIETENESLLESLIYTLNPKVIDENPALNNVVEKNSIWSRKIKHAMSHMMICRLSDLPMISMN